MEDLSASEFEIQAVDTIDANPQGDWSAFFDNAEQHIISEGRMNQETHEKFRILRAILNNR